MSEPYYSDEWVTLYHGDCRDVLPNIGPVETCVTDPPYGISFMSADWDHGVPGAHFWELVRDALLPGATCLAFGGTRTFHRLACDGNRPWGRCVASSRRRRTSTLWSLGAGGAR